MHLQTYSQWRETCIALHMTAQMMGKVKLELMDAQPEWGQVLLDLTADGFTTGLVPHGHGGFEVRLRLGPGEPRVEAASTTGETASYLLEPGASVADYYGRFNLMLEAVGHPCPFNPVPQEMFTRTPFYALGEPLEFDAESARTYHGQCLFALGALLDFTSGFRGKKTQPALFWGTLDLTAVLFSGKPCPFSRDAGIVERVAFDEQSVEFGFWPGDEEADDPAFFVLPYPFIEGPMPAVFPEESYYDAAAAEYVLPLENALRYDDPRDAVTRFFREAFEAVAERQQWDNVGWLTKPLIAS